MAHVFRFRVRRSPKLGVVSVSTLKYMHYNFARVHKTLRVTPAMQAGLANHVWAIEEIRSAKLAQGA
jgi:hypothetical protein